MLMEENLESKHDKHIVPVIAPLGFGKTSGTIKYCDKHKYKYVLVVPNKSNILDAVKSYNLTPYYKEEKLISDRTVTTYNSLPNVLKEKDDFDVIIADEFHCLVSDSNFRDLESTIKLLRKLETKKILLTATQDILELAEFDIWSENLHNSVYLGIQSNITIDNLNLYNCNLLSAFRYIRDLYDYDVIYYDNGLAYYEYCMKDLGYELVTRRNLVKQYDNIFDDNQNLVKRIYTTKCINTGINIMNKGKMRIAIITNNTLLLDIIQFIGRFRRALLDIDIYVIEQKHKITLHNTETAKSSIHAMFDTMCKDVDNLKDILSKYFVVNNMETSSIMDCKPDKFIPKNVFYKNAYVTNATNNFTKVKTARHCYYVYNKDLERLPDKILLSNTDIKDIRTLKTLLQKLNLNIEPIKENRRIIGYKIS